MSFPTRRPRAFWTFLALLPTLFFIVSLAPVQAQRVHFSIGQNLRDAALVVLADTQPTGANGSDILLTFREVLKGDPGQRGQTYTLPLTERSIEGPSVPRQVQGLAVLFGSVTDTGRRPIIETYQTPQDIAALRALMPIYTLPTEREQLEALSGFVNDKNPRFKEQLFDDLSRMRERGSFSTFSSLYSELKPADQVTLLKIINDVGDLRGVPILIQALSSPDHWVHCMAAQHLESTFPGAPGVSEAFRKALDNPDLAPSVAGYLLKREPKNLRLKAIVASTETVWLRLQKQRETGNLAGYRAGLVRIMEDPKASDYTKLSVAEELMSTADTALKERLRPRLLPVLTQLAATGDYIEAQSTATFLRGLHHPDYLPALITLLTRTNSLDGSARQVAALAVLELGPKARDKTITQLLAAIRALPAPPASSDATFSDKRFLFLELAWLGSASDYDRARQTMDAGWQRAWEQAQPLVGVSRQKDEGLFLLHILDARLHKGFALSDDVTDWTIFRLGDLRDKRAVNPLFTYLESRRWAWDYAPREALGKIGGAEVETQARALLTSDDKDWARREAVNLLDALQGPKMLPLLRRMIREPNFGSPTDALVLMARYGTPDDLKTLVPLADFWSGNRDRHYWVQSAVSQIRRRCNYDIQGPIKAH